MKCSNISSSSLLPSSQADTEDRLEPVQAFLRRLTDRIRSQDRTPSAPDVDSLLHPEYGWKEVDRGLSWRKLRLFYGSDTRRPRYWWLLAPLSLIAVQHGLWVFFTSERNLASFALVAGSVLITYRCFQPFVSSLVRCWRATGLINSPPMGQTDGATGNLLNPQTSPTRVADDRHVLSGPLLSIDRSVSPQRIYTVGRPGDHRWLGTYNRIDATDRGVIVHQLGPLLRTARRKRIPIEHLLATHELHELSHWTLEDGNQAVRADHADQWNRRLSAEIRYVSGDDSALWDDGRQESPPERGIHSERGS